MSILLDALKKSETQRSLGETPTIHTNMDEGQAALTASSKRIPALLLLIGFVLMTWMGWQQYLEPEGLKETVATAGEPALEADVPEVVNTDSGPAMRTPVEEFIAPGDPLQSEGTMQDKSEQDISAQRDRLRKSFSQYRSESGEPEMVEDFSAAPADAGQSSTADEAVTRPEPGPAQRHSRVEPHVGEPISYWQVPQSLRDEMGEFRITVMVYAEQPEDRFLLMNGERMEETEETAGGLKLEEIRRGGAIFTYSNYRFLVDR